MHGNPAIRQSAIPSAGADGELKKRPAAKAGRRGRRSVALAARPDQVVRAILAFDQAGVDSRWERRVV